MKIYFEFLHHTEKKAFIATWTDADIRDAPIGSYNVKITQWARSVRLNKVFIRNM